MRRAQKESEILGNCYPSTRISLSLCALLIKSAFLALPWTLNRLSRPQLMWTEYFNNMIILLSDAADPSRYSATEKGVFRREQIKDHATGRWTEPREVWTLYFACSSFMQNKASMLVLALFNLQFIENS